MAKAISTASPAPPSTSVAPMGDARDIFAGISKMTRLDARVGQALLVSKAQVLATDPTLGVATRKALAESMPAVTRGPAPTGVPAATGIGYGVFYKDPFKTNWATGTTLYWEIICPNPPGGNVNTILFLTATNRSALGCEALILYIGQDTTYFVVLDWSQLFSNPLPIIVPFANLANYLQTESSHGHPYQVLPLMNVTVQTAPGYWRNEVCLLDHSTDPSVWQVIYRSDYAATLADQQAGWIGSQGPSIQTFQTYYLGTQPMGALNTQIMSRDAYDQWGQWHQLGPSDSIVRSDNVGFQVLFLDANYNWAVNS